MSLIAFFDYAIIALVLVSLVLIFRLVRIYKNSTIGVSLVYFLIGTFFVLAFRTLLYLYTGTEWGMARVADMTSMVGWHLLFYCFAVAFFIGGRLLVKSVEKDNTLSPSYEKAVGIGFGSVVLAVLIFLAMIRLNGTLSAIEGTFIDSSGIFHFIAFALGIAVAFYLIKIKTRLALPIAVMATPLLWVIIVLGAVHFWELLTESWKIVSVKSETGELVERLISLPAYFFLIYAYWRSLDFIKKTMQQY